MHRLSQGDALRRVLALSLLALSFTFELTGCAGFFFGDGAVVTLTPSATSASYGTSIVLSVSVAAKDSAATEAVGVPTGSVTFYDGSTSLGTATLSSGSGSLTESDLAVGTHTVYALYAGDTNYVESTSAEKTITVSSALTSTTTTLSVASSSVAYGAAVALTATVSSTAATGSVNFYSGTTLLGSATLSSGVASLNTTSLPVGTDSVTATYAGDSTYAASTSADVSVVVSD